MQIVVNHLTKMSPGFICVAGIDTRTNTHVRPKLHRRPRLDNVRENGGVFGIGEVVDLGRARYVGTPPEVEDVDVADHHVAPRSRVDPAVFWGMLTAVSSDRLQQIFGKDLKRVGTTAATDEKHGTASLGCLDATRINDLIVERRHTALGPQESLRISIDVGAVALVLPLTDLRFCKLHCSGDTWLVHHEIVQSVRRRIQDGVPVILSVGLSRPFKPSAADVPRHWLQVNNIHLQDDPLWGCDSLTMPHPEDGTHA